MQLDSTRLAPVSIDGHAGLIQKYGLPPDAEPGGLIFNGELLALLLGQRFSRGWYLDVRGFFCLELAPEPWSVLPHTDGRYLWIIRRDLYPPPTPKGQQQIYLRGQRTPDPKPGEPAERLFIGGLEWEHSDVQVQQACAAIDQFQQPFSASSGGRRPGITRAYTPQQWRDSVARICQERGAHGLRVRHLDIAKDLGLAESTYYSYLARYGDARPGH